MNSKRLLPIAAAALVVVAAPTLAASALEDGSSTPPATIEAVVPKPAPAVTGPVVAAEATTTAAPATVAPDPAPVAPQVQAGADVPGPNPVVPVDEHPDHTQPAEPTETVVDEQTGRDGAIYRCTDPNGYEMVFGTGELGFDPTDQANLSCAPIG